jgi:hypothetical protein
MKSRTASVFQIRAAAIMLGMLGLVIVSSCLPKPLSESSGGINITLYGFSIMKEPLEKAIYPAFIAKAKREHNIDIHFTSSFAGSETITTRFCKALKLRLRSFQSNAMRSVCNRRASLLRIGTIFRSAELSTRHRL